MLEENVQEISKLKGSELKDNIVNIKWYFKGINMYYDPYRHTINCVNS